MELAVFDTFEDAEKAEREERWKMTPEERMAILEQLRSYKYPDGKTAPRLQRVFESVKLSQR